MGKMLAAERRRRPVRKAAARNFVKAPRRVGPGGIPASIRVATLDIATIDVGNGSAYGTSEKRSRESWRRYRPVGRQGRLLA